jgi:hypothetical protein
MLADLGLHWFADVTNAVHSTLEISQIGAASVDPDHPAGSTLFAIQSINFYKRP